MRTLRAGIAGTVGLVLLIGTGLPAVGQDATIDEEILFEVVVPSGAVPDPFRTLYFEGQTLDPGTDGFIGADVELMRGRTIYVDSGQLVLEPMVDALVWRQESTARGDPEEVPAHASVSLTAGDVILLPAIPADELGPEAALRIANPGTEKTVTYGFHMCDGGGSVRVPEGVTHVPPAGGVRAPGQDLAPLASEDAVISLKRMTLEPGATVQLDEDVLFELYRLESGTIDASFTSTADDKRLAWSWVPGGTLPHGDGKKDWELRASSDVPASMLSLTGVELPGSPD